VRRLIHILLLLALTAAGLPTSASAEEGTSIATAPSAVAGQQEFGNLVYGFKREDGCSNQVYESFWTLSVTAGDEITVDWETQMDLGMAVYPAGTSDFTVAKTGRVLTSHIGANGKEQATLTASASGNMPIVFTTEPGGCDFDGSPGSYAFTVYITHELVVSVPRVVTLHTHGSIKVSAHDPEGGVVSSPSLKIALEVRDGGGWATIGAGSVVNSVATIPFKVPRDLRHKRVTLRAVARGSGYRTASSTDIRVRTL
jgi:hypothetical protein